MLSWNGLAQLVKKVLIAELHIHFYLLLEHSLEMLGMDVSFCIGCHGFLYLLIMFFCGCCIGLSHHIPLSFVFFLPTAPCGTARRRVITPHSWTSNQEPAFPSAQNWAVKWILVDTWTTWTCRVAMTSCCPCWVMSYDTFNDTQGIPFGYSRTSGLSYKNNLLFHFVSVA